VAKQLKPLKRILVVKLADFGDALLVEPALRALQKAHPQAQIDVLTTKQGLIALERLPYLHQIILFDKYQFDNPRAALTFGNLKMLATFALQLATARYEAVVFFHHLTTRWGTLKFAGLALATLAPLRVGLDNKTGRAWFLNTTIPDGGFGFAGRSERQYWLQLAETLGAVTTSKANDEFDFEQARPHFVIEEADRRYAQTLFEELSTPSEAPIIAMYVGSGGYALVRRWLPGRFAQVADELALFYGASIVLMGSAAETELAQQVQSQMRQNATVLTGRTTLYEAGAFLEKCTLFIGNDGGLMNLAAIVGTPTLAIFGPTNAIAWQPFGYTHDQAAIVQAELDLPCRPCLYRGLELGHRYGCTARPCLTEISVAQVVEAASKLLAKRKSLQLNP
jgi:heptosyltransferase-2